MRSQPVSSGLPGVSVSVYRSESSAEFFNAAARQVLVLKQCSECEHLRIARRPTCRNCGSTNYTWQDAVGSGVLISWAANARSYGQSQNKLFGLVELDEGPWMEAILVETRPEDLYAGARFFVTFVRGSEGDPFPAFRPALWSMDGSET